MILKTELGNFSTYKDLYLEMRHTGTPMELVKKIASM